jgi:thiazolylpeptide-type bacteriocin precursor
MQNITNELMKLDVENFEIEDINDLAIDAPDEASTELAASDGSCCSCCSCCSSCCS